MTNAHDYLSLQFQSVSNKAYVIECAANVTGTWMIVSDPFVAVSNQTRVLVRMFENMPQAFYRVRLADAPVAFTYTQGYNMPDQWLNMYIGTPCRRIGGACGTRG